MKIAIVCDDLIQYGGAERVFLDILDIYPNATVYTSVISKRWKKILDDRGVKYITSFLQKFPFASKLYRFYSILYLHVFVFESFIFDEYDVVLSLSSRYAHHIITKPAVKHICYMHSPGRMFWDTGTYFKNEFWNLFLFLISPFLFLIRIGDYIAAQRVDYFIANSKVTQKRIKKYYGRDSIVLNPGVDVSKFVEGKSEDFYLIVGRLSSWKRNDIVVKAFNKLGLKLKVLGAGSDFNYLKSISKENIELLGFQSDDVKYDMLSKCKALLFPQYEDFGITPIEAMASGKPVIGYGRGGVLETVIEGKTGVFFDKQEVENIIGVVKKFDQMKFISQNCINRAKEFDKKRFERKLDKLINAVYLNDD